MLDPLGHELRVEFVISIHDAISETDCLPVSGRMLGPAAADDLALLHGAEYAFVRTHIEEIGRDDLVAGDGGLRFCQRGFGGGLIGEDVRLGQIFHPAVRLPIQHVARPKRIGGEHFGGARLAMAA